MSKKFRNITPRTEGDLLREAFSRIEELEKIIHSRGVNVGIKPSPGGIDEVEAATAVNIEETAVNQETTATNQATTAENLETTATNQSTTAVNQSAQPPIQSTTPTIQSTTATNQSTTAVNQSAEATVGYGGSTTTFNATTTENYGGAPISQKKEKIGVNVSSVSDYAYSMPGGSSLMVVEASFFDSAIQVGYFSVGCETDGEPHATQIWGQIGPSFSNDFISVRHVLPGNHGGHKIIATFSSGNLDQIRLRIWTLGWHTHTHNAHYHGMSQHTHTGGSHNHLQNSHTHTQNSHTHTQSSHTHTQVAHTHTQNSHNHTQDSHNHSQNSHNHLQDSHNHDQDPHNHLQEEHTHETG